MQSTHTLKIVIPVTPERAQLWARCEALVLFMDAAQKDNMRGIIGALHDYTQAMQRAGRKLQKDIGPDAQDGPDIAVTLAALVEASQIAEQMMHELRTLLGAAYFAQPGANGETLQ